MPPKSLGGIYDDLGVATAVDVTLGEETVRIGVAGSASNMVVRSLGDKRRKFRKAFHRRLNRLSAVYPPGDAHRRVIRTLLMRELPQPSNWQGAYAELAAYDYLNLPLQRCPNEHFGPLQLHVNLPASRSLGESGRSGTVNLDGFLDEWGVFFEVKALKDSSTEFIVRIESELQRTTDWQSFVMSASYSRDISPEELQPHRKQILRELESKITPGSTRGVRIECVPGLSFQVLWGRGAITSCGYYNPYRHADAFHKLALGHHSDQFVKDAPFLLVWVLNPWFNSLITDFVNRDGVFYRALSRRLFCQYKHASQRFSELRPDFRGPETTYEVCRKLSGVLFLEDSSITDRCPSSANVRAFMYLNPNADNRVPPEFVEVYGRILRDSLRTEDFVHDNY